MIRQGAVQVVLAEPQPVEAFGQSTHQFPLTWNVLQKTDQHELEQDDGIDRRVADRAVKVRYSRADEREIHRIIDPSQPIIRPYSFVERKRSVEKLLLPLLLPSHHNSHPC